MSEQKLEKERQEAFSEGAHLIGQKVIRLARANALLARASGRAEERRWLDLIHALEADLSRFPSVQEADQ